MNKVRIVSAITSATGITLYIDTGKTIELPSTGWRTKAIMDEITRPLAQHKSVVIDLDSYSLEKRVEEKTGGVIRFLRKKLSDFGALFGFNEGGDTSSKGFVDRETVVAVVNGKEIPGMEKMERQIEYAALNSAKGLKIFLERLAKVSSERGHTVQELLNFMERGDLPIADDGSIVAYKMLYAENDEGAMTDPHTRKVVQRLGSFVSMNPKLVDPNRREQCSQGLHVARRGYIKNFSGDRITIIKIAPEDVIAVPYGEQDKMRVCGYHIVAILSKEGDALVRENKPMTADSESAKLLANVIAGKHIGILENVVIGGPKGTDVVTTPVSSKQLAKDIKKQIIKKSEPIVEEVKALDDVKEEQKVSAKDINRVVAEVEAEKKAKVAVKKAEKPAAAPAVKHSPPPAFTTQDQKKLDLVPEKYHAAIKQVVLGEISQREAEKKYSVSAKKLRAILRENGWL